MEENWILNNLQPQEAQSHTLYTCHYHIFPPPSLLKMYVNTTEDTNHKT